METTSHSCRGLLQHPIRLLRAFGLEFSKPGKSVEIDSHDSIFKNGVCFSDLKTKPLGSSSSFFFPLLSPPTMHSLNHFCSILVCSSTSTSTSTLNLYKSIQTSQSFLDDNFHSTVTGWPVLTSTACMQMIGWLDDRILIRTLPKAQQLPTVCPRYCCIARSVSNGVRRVQLEAVYRCY